MNESKRRMEVAKAVKEYVQKLRTTDMDGDIDALHYELDLKYGCSKNHVRQKLEQIEKQGKIKITGDTIQPKHRGENETET